MSAYSDLVLLDRPVAYWPLDDAGPTFADLGPSGVTLQQVGTVTPQHWPGPVDGNCAGFAGNPDASPPYTLDGLNGYLVGNGSPDPSYYDSAGNIDTTSVPYVNVRGPLTLEAWLLAQGDGAFTPAGNVTQGYFGWGDPDDGGTAAFGSGISGTAIFADASDGFTWGLDTYSYQYNTWSLPTGSRHTTMPLTIPNPHGWMHVVTVIDAHGQSTVYVNGVVWSLAVAQPWVFNFPPGNSLNTFPYQEAVWFTLGCVNLAGTTWPHTGGVSAPSGGWMRIWNGGLGHVALYNYALSACQIQSHYYSVVGPPCAGSVTPTAPLLLTYLDAGPYSVVQATYTLFGGGHGESAAGPTTTLVQPDAFGIARLSVDLTSEVMPPGVTRMSVYVRGGTGSTSSPTWTDWTLYESEYSFSNDVGLPWSIDLGYASLAPSGGWVPCTPPDFDSSCMTCMILDPDQAVQQSAVVGAVGWATFRLTYTFTNALGQESDPHNNVLVRQGGVSGMTQISQATYITREAYNMLPGQSGPPLPADATGIRWYVDPPATSGAGPIPYTYSGWLLAGTQTISAGSVAPFTFHYTDAGSWPAATPPVGAETCVPGASSPYSSAVLADRPSAYFPLDDASSPYADASPSGYVGTPSGAISTGTVPFSGSGPSKLFTKGNTYPTATAQPKVTLSAGGATPLSALPHTPTTFSLEAWIRVLSPSTAPASGAITLLDLVSGHEQVWELFSSTGATGLGYPFYLSSRFYQTSLTVADIYTSTLPTGTAWHHYVVTYDGAGTLLVYSDATSRTVHVQDTFGDSVGTVTSAVIGGAVTTGDATAEYAHVALYNYALSSCQVSDHYLVATTGVGMGCKSYNDLVLCDGPSCFWPLDGNSSAPYADLSCNKNDLHEQQLSVNTPPPPALTHNSSGGIGGQGSITFNGTTWLENSMLRGVFYDVDTTGGFQSRGGQNTFVSKTFECWMKVPTPTSWVNFSAVTMQQNTSTNSVMEFFYSTGPGSNGYGTNQGQLVLDNGFSNVNPQGPQTITWGSWHHLVVTYDWSNSLHFEPGPFTDQFPDFYTTGVTFYVDGVAFLPGGGAWFSDRWNNPGGWPGDAYFDWWSRADVVRLGARYGDGYGYTYPSYNPHPDQMNGMSLAGVAIYDYALGACQVLAHYQKATTGSYTPCSPCCAPPCGHGRRQIHVFPGA